MSDRSQSSGDLDLARIFLNFHLGELHADEVKRLVHAHLDRGIYRDNYDLAVAAGELPREHVDAIMEVLLADHAGLAETMRATAAAIESVSDFHGVECDVRLVDQRNVIYADGLRLHRIEDGVIRWSTPRISVDGMRNVELSPKDIVSVDCFIPDSGFGSWKSFEVAYETGKAISTWSRLWS